MPKRKAASAHEVMTLEEVAAWLHAHPMTIYRLLREHKIPAFKIGGDWRFKREAIERWIKRQERK
jgi:excisionase family DNA binding protein